METYTVLRAFADSWFLIAMFAFFLGAAIWAFWPSQRAARLDAATIPFREEPAARAERSARAGETDYLKGAEDV